MPKALEQKLVTRAGLYRASGCELRNLSSVVRLNIMDLGIPGLEYVTS